jgi:hypothetical protein
MRSRYRRNNDDHHSSEKRGTHGLITNLIEVAKVYFQFNRISRNYVGRFLAFVVLIVSVSEYSSACDTSDSDSTGSDPIPAVEKFWGVGDLVHPTTPLRGAASCAASSCHGGPLAAVSSATVPRGSEYPLFIENDPHSRSWRTLNSQESIEILTKLGILRSGEIVQPKAWENCLACHNTDRMVVNDDASPYIVEGVGCESCHGPSQTWYDSHYQGPATVRRAKSELGLIDTKPLLQRARTCTLCHVGAKDRDMNHDIIAAGHPALYFDMAVYHDAYPKHWREAESNEKAFRAKLWWAGQVAKADAELELLEARTTSNHTVSVWPEFAMFQCTSCHVTLDGSPSEPNTSPASDAIVWDTLGKASVRRWNLRGVELLLEGTPSSGSQQVNSTKKSVEELLAAINTPNAPKDSIANRATVLRNQIARQLSQENARLSGWTAQSQQQHALRRLQQSVDTQDWEQAALAYVATWTAIHQPVPSSLKDDMATIRNGLVFPLRSQSPLFPRSEASETRPSRQEWSAAVQHIVDSIKMVQP